MQKMVVTYTLTPTNYNRPTSVVVEAETERDAILIVKDAIRDLGECSQYVYKTRPYTAPPKGRILGTLSESP